MIFSETHIGRLDAALQRSWLPPLILLLASCAMYVPVILAHPEFYLDDFYFLALIDGGIFPHAFDGETYRYFASLRPLFMLSLLADHALFGTHSGWYYVMNLVLHGGAGVALYHVLRRVFRMFFDADARLLSLLLALAFLVHADMFYGAVWISNRTETLMVLLYLLTVLATLRFLAHGQWRVLPVAVLLFLLTLAAKAQAAHFPLLLLFMGGVLLRRRKTPLGAVQIVLASLPFFFLSAAYAWTTVQYDPALGVVPWQYLPQKVMSAIGILLIAVQPHLAEPAYAFFLQNKIAVLLLGIPLLGAAYFTWRRLSVRDRWLAVGLLLLYGILLYPRIMYYAAPRVNSLQVLFVIIVLGVITLRMRSTQRMWIPLLFLVLHFAGTIAFALPRWYVRADNARYVRLLSEEQNNPRRYYQVLHWQHYDPYAMHYFRHGSFGKDTLWTQSPVRIGLFYGRGTEFDYDVRSEAGAWVFSSDDPRIHFERDTVKQIMQGTRFEWRREEMPQRFQEVVVHDDSLAPYVVPVIERNFQYEILELPPRRP